MSRRSVPEGREIRTVRHALRVRRLSVSGVEELSAGIRRLRLTGDELERDFPFPELAPSDHVKVFLPDEVTGELVLPIITDDGIRGPKGAKLSARRDYTVRGYDAEHHELILEFVLHEHGPAGRWAAAASIGTELGVAGPRRSHLFSADYAHYLLLGDETALPGIGRWLDSLPGEVRVEVVVVLTDASHEIALPAGLGRSVTWLVRPTQERIDAAVQGSLLGPDSFVWAAGESGMLRSVRRWLRTESGLERWQWDVDGYWKRGHADVDHHQLSAEADAEDAEEA